MVCVINFIIPYVFHGCIIDLKQQAAVAVVLIYDPAFVDIIKVQFLDLV